MMLHGDQRAQEVLAGDIPQQPARRLNGEDGRSTVARWMDTRQAPEDRLIAFDAWLKQLLATKLEWPKNPETRQRHIGQCQQFALAMVAEMKARGWLFDGPKLAKHMEAAVDEIAAAQRAGRVRDLWMFFRHVMTTYVGARAEELQAEAMSAGAAVAAVFSRIKTQAPTMTELVAQRRQETLSERVRKRRAARRAEESDDGQGSLFA